MKRVKGCLNNNCIEYKKTYYKKSDEYCVKCGAKLSYVCMHHKCFKQIPDNIEETYCPVHLAERKDKKEKRDNVLKKVVNGVAVVGVGVVTITKAVVDITKKK